MARLILGDELWELIGPLLPPPKKRRRRNPGRKPKDNRSVLTGILFVLKTGIPWEYLPQEMGCGSGMTCWRRLRDWQEAGVWEKIRCVLLQRLEDAKQIDWSRAIVDSMAHFISSATQHRKKMPRRRRESLESVLSLSCVSCFNCAFVRA